MKKHVYYTEDFEGVTCRLSHEPWGDIYKSKTDNEIIMGYFVQDYVDDIDDLIGDSMGKLLSLHRHSKDIQEAYSALGLDYYGDKNLDLVQERHEDEAISRFITKVLSENTVDELKEYFLQDYEQEESDIDFVKDCLRQSTQDSKFSDTMNDVLNEMWHDPKYHPGDKDAVLLDCYQHGGQYWSLSGGGMQCQWDTARGAGVWVPDDYLRLELQSATDRASQARIYAKQFLDQYNAIISGEVYGVVVDRFDREGEKIDSDACFGYVGFDWAMENLKMQMEVEYV